MAMIRKLILMLFAALIVAQSLAIAGDVAPVHSDHGEYSEELLSEELVDAEHDAPAGHRHSCHCHGSHMPMWVALDLALLPLAVALQTPYSVGYLSAEPQAILRPPIA